MTAKDRKSLGCVVPTALYYLAKARAERFGISPSAYLRKLVIEDVQSSEHFNRELGIDETALLAACVSVAKQLIGSVDEETILRLSRTTVDMAEGDH